MNKKLSSLKIHNIVVCAIILIVFVIFGVANARAEEINNNDEVLPSNNIQLGNNYRKLIDENKEKQTTNTKKKESNILNIKEKEIKFFSEIFGYNYEDVLNNLKGINNETYNEYNIGNIKNNKDELIKYNSFEYGLIEYFYNLNKEKSLKKTNKYVPYTGDSLYVENLIIYFSSIYDNVDSKLLLGIGAAESGYYKVKYMLRLNNIYGGMSSKGLIKYNNIELGVLTYVRMMSRNYYAKGLTNLYSIGKVYCPTYENASKIASPHWISLINKALIKYELYNYNVELKDIWE